VPTLYRIHEQPSQEKLRALIPVLVHFGLHLPPQSHITPAHLQNVLGKTEGMGEVGPILRRVVLRAMMKACYSPDNLGHYGLGSRCYCHFTSPIRRYPDLIVHRTLKMILKGEHRDAEAVKEWGQPLASLGEYCSGQERVSADIEYESTALKGMEFMWRFLGQEFDGIICSITNFGFFVELIDYPIEGLVPVNSIGGEFWDFDEAGLRLIGRTTGRAFRLGDQVRVSIETIDIPNRRMELTLVR
ncbi:MAG TPA: RNB domain-containing ribonuclease, partial [Candidatus Sumerlaeota bacterium]|nr:RNB domain-containing ribonuclease [Candidatus Sumerlaeota bacterium]